MKRSTLRKVAALALALATVTSSCSIFKVQSEVTMSSFPIDLTFGAKPPAQPTRLPDVEFPDIPPQPPFPLPGEDDDDDDFEPKPPPPALCPPFPTASGARDEATPDMREGAFVGGSTGDGGQEPRDGTYLYRYAGNYENGAPSRGQIGYKAITDFVKAEDGSWTFAIEDVGPPGLVGNRVSPISYMKLLFRVVPADEDAVRPGLYLAGIEWPKKEGDPTDKIPFQPVTPIPLLNFPIEPGQRVVGAAADVAGKDKTGVGSPTGGDLRRPSTGEIRSEVNVGSPELVEVCDQFGQGWKVAWTLTTTGEYAQTMSGLFWIGTQYSGLPIKEQYVLESVTDNLVQGNFETNMMRLDPGDYL